MIKPLPHVREMAAYQLADLKAPPGKRIVSLSQNESIRPPSPMVLEAISAASSPHLYPDPDWSELRQAIAKVHGVDPNEVLCGNGSLDLIGVLARTFIGSGDAAVVPAHAYPFFTTATQATGAKINIAPEHDLTVSIENILDTVCPNTRIVFVANPANPTGTRIPRSGLLALREKLSDDVILVIDEAYGEFADHLNEAMFDQVQLGNVIVLRTFSKAYGLAGLRVGWGLFPKPLASEVRKLMNPNNVSVVGQNAAEAAMQDQAYMRETCDLTAATRDQFRNRMREMGIRVPQSFTNFVVLEFSSADIAAALDAALRAEGIFLRAQGGAGLGHCLRATVGSAEDMERVADFIQSWLKERGGNR